MIFCDGYRKERGQTGLIDEKNMKKSRIFSFLTAE